MPIVYRHIRLDNNAIFYIGIGKKPRRAFDKYGRSKHWRSVVNKHGYRVEITHEDVCWEEACVIEKYLIDFYGRKDLGKGQLVNMTDGGDGTLNISEESKKNIIEAGRKMVGEKNPMYGRKRPDFAEFSRKMDKSGPNNYWYKITGPAHPCYGRKREDTAERNRARKGKPLHENTVKGFFESCCRKVIDLSTGIIYPSIKEASISLGIKNSTLKAWLTGRNKNKSSLRYYELEDNNNNKIV